MAHLTRPDGIIIKKKYLNNIIKQLKILIIIFKSVL